MSKTEVHQFLPSFNLPDAIGYHTLRTKEAVASAGFGGGIWGEEISGDLHAQARSFHRYEHTRSARSHKNLLMYQASTGSRGMVDFLLERPERLTLCYHNITPHEFFLPYDAGAAISLQRGRDEMKSLAKRVRVALACSEFNASELQEWGIEDVRVLPPYLPDVVQMQPDPVALQRLRAEKSGIDVVFVGRVVPNKGHIHLMRAFGALRSQDPGARLFVVGRWGPEAYMRTLFRIRERIGNSRCTFTGPISAEQLAALYQECDFFISLSEHEGFGVPLIEAMRAGLPVIAYAAGGTPETMGGAGVLLRTLDPIFISEVVLRIAQDEKLRKELVDRQKDRANEVEAVSRDMIIGEAVNAARDV